MANKEIGFSIKILGTDEQLAQLTKVESELKKVSDKKKELNALSKVGAISEKEYAQGIAKVGLESKNLQQSKRALQRSIEVENNLLMNQLGSYNQMSSQLNKLRQDYRNLSEAERNSAKGTDLIKKIDKLDVELKEIDASMGQYQRNVGNYKSAVEGLGGILAQHSPAVSNIFQTYQQISVTITQVVSATKAYTSAQTAQTGATKALNSATSATTKTLRILRLALIATGIGAIVVVIGSLVAAFLSTQKGINTVNRALQPLKAVFATFVGFLQNTALKVFDGVKGAIDNPRQAMIDFGNAIKENIINRIKAFSVAGAAIAKILKGDIAEGFTELSNAFIQGTTGIEDGIGKFDKFLDKTTEATKKAAQTGADIARLQEQIREIEIKNSVQREKLLADVKKFNDIAEDTAKSEKERADAAQRAIEENDKVLKLDKELINAKIQLKEAQNSLNDTDYDDQLELENLKAELFKKETERQEARTTLRNKFNIIQDQVERERLKKAEDYRKEEESLIKEQLESIHELTKELRDQEIENMQVGIEKEKAILEAQRADDIEKLKSQIVEEIGLQGQKLENARIINDRINRLIEAKKTEHLRNLADLEKKYGEESIKEIQKITDIRISHADNEARLLELKVRAKVASEVISEREGQREILKIRENALQSQLSAIERQQNIIRETEMNLKGELIDLRNQQKTEEVRLMIEATEAKLAQLEIEDEAIKLKYQELLTGLAEITKQQSEDLETDNKTFIGTALGLDPDQEALYYQQAQSIYNSLTSLKQSQEKRELERQKKHLNQQKDQELKLLEEKFKRGLISEEQYNQRKESINQNYSAKVENAEKAALRKQKQRQVTMARIFGILSVLNALATVQPLVPAGLIQAAAMGLKSTAEIQAIKSQSYRYGGLMYGKSHEQGGIKGSLPDGTNIEVEGGEYMINRRSIASNDVMSVTGTPRQIAAAINSYKGYGRDNTGIRMAAFGGSIPTPSSPPTPSVSSKSTDPTFSRSEMDYLASRIITGINDKKVILVQSDVEEAAKESTTVKTTATW